MDLLDRLIADIFQVTQQLMESDEVDLQAFAPQSSSVEKSHMSKGLERQRAHLAERPMREGVHRSVC